MVIQAEEEARRRWDSVGLAKKPVSLSMSRRSAPQSRLHNFSFPTLSWGNQKLLRCVHSSGRSMDHELQTARRCSTSSSLDELPPPTGLPLRFPGRIRGAEEEEAKGSAPFGSLASRPWNLKSRRSYRNAPAENAWNRNPPSASSQSASPSDSPVEKEKTSTPLIFLTKLEGLEVSQQGGRRKFSMTLSREEIEADFLRMKGIKPPRRPKKRAKYLQRQLDALSPGVLLSEVTPDLYKTAEIES